ncbi:hypothetical protein EYY95_06150 [Hafnia alvei]|uniref:hypothetical protein n=1 Tax=Hafnia alvei TaxID=569 RepID=UPI00103390C0|nr:hypothetical protein [Hafnia alvei]TBL89946.1 hypothetical protein EYY95_06150 [Hafnia alvei]
MNKIILISCIFLIICASFFSFRFRYYQVGSEIRCTSIIQYQFIYENIIDTSSGSLLFMLSGDKGVITYNAKVNSGGKQFIINREADVEYLLKNDFLHIRTTKLIIRDGDNLPSDIAFKYLYGFLIRKDGWVSLKIDREFSSGYVISTSIIPQFYCNKL